MRPVTVSPSLSFGGWWWARRITVQPFAHSVRVKLLTPDHPCKRLALYEARVLVRQTYLNLCIKIICFFLPLHKDAIEICKWTLVLYSREPQSELRSHSSSYICHEEQPRLCSLLRRIHCVFVFVNDVLVECILEVTFREHAIQPPDISLVLAEQSR